MAKGIEETLVGLKKRLASGHSFLVRSERYSEKGGTIL
jgi:hypothetical protein